MLGEASLLKVGAHAQLSVTLNKTGRRLLSEHHGRLKVKLGVIPTGRTKQVRTKTITLLWRSSRTLAQRSNFGCPAFSAYDRGLDIGGIYWIGGPNRMGRIRMASERGVVRRGRILRCAIGASDG